ncbi:IS3 family transposase [Oceanobacillus halophilus]|uniref:Integrase catalytic domain-containing protein n=1 Tax=Oceanobacillus halophilus TaxID=930130 RepID=A0A495A7B5_9BACI|nr:hypothetical protein D8M06_07680 [Oceanobacillus halophilus]
MACHGSCIDNGPIESFWGILKCQKYYLHKYEHMKRFVVIDKYMKFYNHDRYQKRLDGLIPLKYRAKAA